jgi:uncharacterized iron-regulated protein
MIAIKIILSMPSTISRTTRVIRLNRASKEEKTSRYDSILAKNSGPKISPQALHLNTINSSKIFHKRLQNCPDIEINRFNPIQLQLIHG